MTAPSVAAKAQAQKGAGLALALATLGMAANFWAWAMLNPLASDYKKLLDLSPFSVSIMVAVPVIVGSLGRIPAGALTDKFGGRKVFAALCFLSILPVAFLAVSESYSALVAGGFVLGIAGASFAIGVPYVSSWFPPERRGFALGVYGMGNIGSAIAGFVAPRVADGMSREWAFAMPAIALAVVGALFLLIGRDSPTWSPNPVPFVQRFKAAARLPISADLAAVYAITFGGFVAFGAYLPTYLVEVYDLTRTDAAARASGFVLVATIFRPIGGILSDRISAVTVILVSLCVVGVFSIVVSFQPEMVVATVAFLTMAAALGTGNGAVFALVGKRAPAAQVGGVTGFVGAAGGLGGFLPPLVMGLVFQATDSYAIGLMLLSDVAFVGAVFTFLRLRTVYGAPAER
jgi:NNP family nitrate/nitrite transporter-like MFS transporter